MKFCSECGSDDLVDTLDTFLECRCGAVFNMLNGARLKHLEQGEERKDAQWPEDRSGPRDWPEDYRHENGAYMNTCMHCKMVFVGHKRRLACKLCGTPDD